MSEYTHDLAVLVGRFQPFHKGHQTLLDRALASAARVVVVLGSALRARDAKNPFTWEERAQMTGLALSEEQRARLSFVPVRDYYDDRLWRDAVAQAIGREGGGRVALVGFFKDASSYYLNLFPDWDFLPVEREHPIDATGVRRALFESQDAAARRAVLLSVLHPAVVDYLHGWACQGWFPRLQREHASLQKYRESWSGAPYEPIFVTVDSVLRAAGHVLLIRRGGEMGEGLWALPGGFVEPQERLLQSALRELREETGFGVLELTLAGALREVAVFDHPSRSQRGRTITHAHFFDLGEVRLPEVRGGDDAAHAAWVPVAELAALETSFFEDHYTILSHFLGLARELPE
ncbi:bifunctional nicotinamide-nucleotide adenylyltransferase/Nudix hydroxylase [Niveibacterium sp. SC-1]|uniref:bifunctional nicotinamide-nucleotide adenylyltransferase/Nudix hydroxylase n=1 Tax=Niveibacterium sp. SC-1 TaxID=3135646 RepID=UPI00311F788B